MIPWLTSGAALACGGFFCDSVEPVAQSAERILFRQDETGDWTTFVEVQFAGPPIDFGWVIPIPRILDPATEIDVAPAGLFDALEAATAPRFLAGRPDEATAMSSEPAGCGYGCGPGFLGASGQPDTSGVAVVGAAVVGPYDLQVITAGDAENLTNWLQQAGYPFPFSAAATVDGYVDGGYAFLGVKLAPDVPSGPIDTLVLRCGAFAPRIPLMLTAVAAVEDMEIVAYVLADERYVPGDGWAEVVLDPTQVNLEPDGTTDYPFYLQTVVDAMGGRGFRTEYAAPAASFVHALDPATQEALGHGAYLTRMRTFLSAHQMTSDPMFVADPVAPDVSNVVYLGSSGSTASVLGLGLLVIGVGRRRALRSR